MKRNMKFLSFWSINDGIRTEPLCQQMLQMKHHGMEGVVFHPRFYPGGPDYMTPEFIKVVGEVILYAKSIGMEFWIYDENGWPSGAADGQVLKKHPDSKRWGITYIDESDIKTDDQILCYHHNKVVVARGATGVSPLCRETTDTFLALTHERYFKELPAEAFEYVTGFFCDEVDYFPGHLFGEGAVPWCADFEKVFIEKYGCSPCADLWKIFVDGDEYSEFKIRFWETAGDLIARNFYRPYLDWCEKHGKLFTGHLKGEESPYFQLMFSGSCFTQLKGLSLPAIDTLERYHGNHFFPYVLSSVAAQQGRVGCLAEAMGGAGWGVAPEDLMHYMEWLAEAGVERVVLHLGQFLLKAQAIRDWPPSVPLHLTWHEAFASVLDEIRKLSSPLLTAAWEEPKVLIVTPTRGVMASYQPLHSSVVNLHDGSGIPDSASAKINAEFLEMVENCYHSGMKYHFTEERELKNAYLQDGKLCLGSKTYEKVLVDKGCRFENDEQYLINEMKSMGLLIDAPRHTEAICKNEKEPCFIPAQTKWMPQFPDENQYLIEWDVSGNGVLQTSVDMVGVDKEIALVFSDPISALKTNAKTQLSCDAGTKFILSGFGDVLTIEVVPGSTQSLPFAWLRGDFAVFAKGGFSEFDSYQSFCRGEFFLNGKDEVKKLDCGELVSQGLPFFGGLVVAEKKLTLTKTYQGHLSFAGLSVTAAMISIDGVPIGWWWNGHAVAVSLEEGEHTIVIAVAPSTYNMYGPHHYYLGDCRLTSPDTFFGRGGYTDNPDAPSNTFIDTMQFVNFTVDGNIVLGQNNKNCN